MQKEKLILNYGSPPGGRGTNWWLLFYVLFVFASLCMACLMLATGVMGGFLYGIPWMLAQVVIWVLTIDLHQTSPENPADDMKLMRKTLLGLGMGISFLAFLGCLFHY